MRKISTVLFAIWIVVSLAGCVGNYDFSLDKGPLQIGIRHNRTPQPAELRNIHFRLGLPWWIHNSKKESDTLINGVVLAPLCNGNEETLNGVGVSCLFACDKANGVLLAPLLSVSKKVNGLSISCINSSLYQSGFQAGLINFVGFMTPGEAYAQIGLLNIGGTRFQVGVTNLHNGSMQTFQLGGINWDDGDSSPFSCQAGLFNSAARGFQIGFLNRNDSAKFIKWCPILNF